MTNNFCHTLQQSTPWISLKLQQQTSVAYVQLFNRIDCCSDRLSPFQLWVGQVEGDFDSSTSLACGIHNLTVPTGVGPHTLSCGGRLGQYVTIVLPGELRILNLAEIRVYASNPGRRLSQVNVESFTDRKLTTCGQTGPTGPSQHACDVAYGDSFPRVTVYGGFQLIEVKTPGVYAISADGGAGGRVGEGCSNTGAKVSGCYKFTSAVTLIAVIGQKGEDAQGCHQDGSGTGGGGGGTFVAVLADGKHEGEHGFRGTSYPSAFHNKSVTLLIVAGGGAGNDDGNWGCAQSVPEVQHGKAVDGGAANVSWCGGAGFKGPNTNGGATKTFLQGAFSSKPNGMRQSGGFGGGAASCNSGGGGGGYWGGFSNSNVCIASTGTACASGGTSFWSTSSFFVPGSAIAVAGGNEAVDGLGAVRIQAGCSVGVAMLPA